MAGRYLLDTNIVIAALGSATEVLERIDDADECFISSTVLGEMLFGALNSSNSDANVERLRIFSAGATFLACDEATAFVYGEIKTSLRRIGKPIQRSLPDELAASR